MATKVLTMEYERNTTLPISYTYQKNGVDSNDGITLFFTVKQVEDDISTDDSTAIVKKNITMSGPTNSFTIDPGDIADTVKAGKYFFDFKVKESDGPPKRIYPGLSGVFLLDVKSTNRES